MLLPPYWCCLFFAKKNPTKMRFSWVCPAVFEWVSFYKRPSDISIIQCSVTHNVCDFWTILSYEHENTEILYFDILCLFSLPLFSVIYHTLGISACPWVFPTMPPPLEKPAPPLPTLQHWLLPPLLPLPPCWGRDPTGGRWEEEKHNGLFNQRRAGWCHHPLLW